MPKLTSENYWLAVGLAVVGLRSSSRTATWFEPSKNDRANCWLALLALLSHYKGRKDANR